MYVIYKEVILLQRNKTEFISVDFPRQKHAILIRESWLLLPRISDRLQVLFFLLKKHFDRNLRQESNASKSKTALSLIFGKHLGSAIFSYFSKKTGPDISRKQSPSETVCMDVKSCFLRKISKTFQNVVC